MRGMKIAHPLANRVLDAGLRNAEFPSIQGRCKSVVMGTDALDRARPKD
jgi:hypothetical protein